MNVIDQLTGRPVVGRRRNRSTIRSEDWTKLTKAQVTTLCGNQV